MLVNKAVHVDSGIYMVILLHLFMLVFEQMTEYWKSNDEFFKQTYLSSNLL